MPWPTRIWAPRVASGFSHGLCSPTDPSAAATGLARWAARVRLSPKRLTPEDDGLYEVESDVASLTDRGDPQVVVQLMWSPQADALILDEVDGRLACRRWALRVIASIATTQKDARDRSARA